MMEKRKITADEMLLENEKAIYKGEKPPYTKQQHSQVEECTVFDRWRWNYWLPDAEQYTKEEIKRAETMELLNKKYK